MIYKYIHKEPIKMKQLLVKLTDQEYQALEEYCKNTGRTKSSVIRYQISKLSRPSGASLIKRKINRISLGRGRLLSEVVLEMRR